MKKVKIRFIEKTDKSGEIGYYLQIKKLFWWEKVRKFVTSNNTGIWITEFCDSKEFLLERYILEHIKKPLSEIQVWEFPMLKQY